MPLLEEHPKPITRPSSLTPPTLLPFLAVLEIARQALYQGAISPTSVTHLSLLRHSLTKSSGRP